MMAAGTERAGRLGQALGSIARGVGYLVAGIVGWVVAFLAIAATFVGFSYLRSGNPPYCQGAVPGFTPPAGSLRLDYLAFIAIPGATLLVGLWWVLGARTAASRARRLVVLLPVAVVVSFAVLLPTTIGLLPGFSCPMVV